MEIYQIASELAPIAKVGGLGDVIYGLSKELSKLSHDVTIFLPKYQCLNVEEIENMHLLCSLSVCLPSNAQCNVDYWKGYYHNLTIIFVDPKAPYHLFDTGAIYGQHNDTQRFLLFSYLCLEYLSHYANRPICLHLHDWQAAFTAAFYKMYFQSALPSLKTVLTIHNLMHQGKALFSDLHLFNIPKDRDFLDPQHPQCINLLKSGMLYADDITTVSPTYAEDICNHSYSYHLDATISDTRHKTQGILNGIDYSYWNPSKQHLLPYPYSNADAITAILEKKQKNKETLQKKFNMELGTRPLYCCISRLDHQKGPYLLAAAAEKIIANDGQYFLLGKPATHEMYELFSTLQRRLGHSNFIFFDGFDEKLSHLVYASADFILIPSIFEPCGLTQLIAMHYGTIPIARKTGGLADTVIDLNDAAHPKESRTGLSFEAPTPEAFLEKVDESFALFRHSKQREELVARIMKKNFSWEIPAKMYLKLYQQ